jgi:hypothetical protein
LKIEIVARSGECHYPITVEEDALVSLEENLEQLAEEIGGKIVEIEEEKCLLVPLEAFGSFLKVVEDNNGDVESFKKWWDRGDEIDIEGKKSKALYNEIYNLNWLEKYFSSFLFQSVDNFLQKWYTEISGRMRNLEEFIREVWSRGGNSITIEVTERILKFFDETKIKYYFRLLGKNNSEMIEYVARRMTREFPFSSRDIGEYRMKIMRMAFGMALKIFQKYGVSSTIKFPFITKELTIQELEEEIKRRFETFLKKQNEKLAII